jgi:hypothetical protein
MLDNEGLEMLDGTSSTGSTSNRAEAAIREAVEVAEVVKLQAMLSANEICVIEKVCCSELDALEPAPLPATAAVIVVDCLDTDISGQETQLPVAAALTVALAAVGTKREPVVERPREAALVNQNLLSDGSPPASRKVPVQQQHGGKSSGDRLGNDSDTISEYIEA